MSFLPSSEVPGTTFPSGGDWNFPQFPSGTEIGDFPTVGGGFAGGLDLDTSQPPQYLLKADGTEVSFYTMLEMGINSGSKLPSEPIEQGSFATYNRVIEPLGGTCRLALQGTDAEIQSTLNALEELKTGTQKIEFITPFDSYENLMLESYDYRRDGNSGYNVLFVDLRLVEVREVETQKTTSSVDEPEQPISADDAADGSVASAEDYGETPTYSPSSAEVESAESEAGSGGRSSSVLHDMFGKV